MTSDKVTNRIDPIKVSNLVSHAKLDIFSGTEFNYGNMKLPTSGSDQVLRLVEKFVV